MRYKAITSENFYYQELKNICKYVLENGEIEGLKDKLYEDDILDHVSTSNFQKKYRTVYKRMKSINTSIMMILIKEDSYTGKFINLYSILCSERIVREFTYEVLREKYSNYNYTLNNQDFISFIELKSHQSKIVNNWSESGKKKVIVKLKNFLIEGGLLIKEQDDLYRIIRPLILPEIIDILRKNNDDIALKAMLY